MFKKIAIFRRNLKHMKGEHEIQAYEPINLRKVIADKNPKMAKRIPGFIYHWLDKLLHIDEINDILSKTRHLSGAEFIGRALELMGVKYTVVGHENIPRHGRYFFTSNHPLGGLDGVVLLKVLNETAENKTRALANDFLMAVKPLQEFFVPINKVGGQARDSIKLIEELYNSPDQIMMFPAGLCSRKIKGQIVDLTWQKHFIQRARQHNMDIVPVFFEGKNTNRFYNLAKIRKFLGIKFNFEMITLSDEMFRQKNKTFTLHFGKPIDIKTLDNSKTPLEWAQYVKNIVYSLPNKR